MTEQHQQSSLLGKIAAYTEIWSKDPSSTIFVSLSEAYRKMGMLDEAKSVVVKGLLNHPDFSPAHIVLARIRCQQGDYQGSDDSFKRALEIDPDSLAALVGYARLKILLGQESSARELLLAARNQSPADSVINKLLLSLPDAVEPVAEKQEPAEEVESSSSASAPPSPLASVTLAELYLKQGLEQEALQMYRQLSALKPTDLMLRRQIRNLEDRQIKSKPTAEESVAEKSVSSLDSPEPDTEIVAEIENDESDTLVPDDEVLDEAIGIPETVTVAPVISDRSAKSNVLEAFNSWLENIQRRRGDV